MIANLNFSHIGQGFPLIILHGLFGSSSNWRNIAKALSEHYSVYCLDARNHGNSDWAQSMSYTNMAADIVNFMHANKLEQAHIIGHSMGGKTAMTLGLQYPEKVAQLIVADIAPIAYTHHQNHQLYIDAMQALDLKNLSGGRKHAQQLLSAQLNEPDTIIQFLLQNLVYKNQQYRWRINLAVFERELATIMDFDLSATQLPSPHRSLFIYGENSNYIQDADFKTIRALFPKAQITAIENAGHWIHAQQPIAFTRAITDFLASETKTHL